MNTKSLVFLGIFLITALLHVRAFASEDMKVDRVAKDRVCMVNDSVMGRQMIPVEVEGATYYGCCQGCVTRLKTDISIRYSMDPITGTRVDKAKAFILGAPDGKALYFESEASAYKYLKGQK